MSTRKIQPLAAPALVILARKKNRAILEHSHTMLEFTYFNIYIIKRRRDQRWEMEKHIVTLTFGYGGIHTTFYCTDRHHPLRVLGPDLAEGQSPYFRHCLWEGRRLKLFPYKDITDVKAVTIDACYGWKEPTASVEY